MDRILRCPLVLARGAVRTTVAGLRTVLGFRRRAVRRETAAVTWFDGVEPDDLAG